MGLLESKSKRLVFPVFAQLLTCSFPLFAALLLQRPSLLLPAASLSSLLRGTGRQSASVLRQRLPAQEVRYACVRVRCARLSLPSLSLLSPLAVFTALLTPRTVPGLF